MGFFTKQQTASTTRPDGKALSCASCGLYKNAHSPKMKPYGNFKKEIMCIGEYPREVEDIRGKPFQGRDGALLYKTLKNFGIDLFEDCINLNALSCMPEEDHSKKEKYTYEITCCRRFVLSAIEEYKPKLILVFGNAALVSLIGNRWKKDYGEYKKWTGYSIPDQDLKTWICPVFSPAYVKNSEKQEIETVWNIDIQNALHKLNETVPIFKEPNIIYLKETELGELRKVKSTFAFDYETTGLKPHAKGHKIICASVATSESEAYVFMMPEKRSLRMPFIELLENESIGKIAQNMKFEHTWSRVRLNNTIVKSWIWDTMLGTHLLDNRTGVTGLKFQTYVQFGVIDYSSEISPILEAADSNSFNQLENYVKTHENAQKVLKYCALDSIFEFKLANLQQKLFEQLTMPF